MQEEKEPNDGAHVVERLLAMHERQIRRFIQRRSGHQVLRRRTLDDLFQDTVTAAISSSHTFVFQGDKAFLGWIQTIARRSIAQAMGTHARGPVLRRIHRDGSSGSGVAESALGIGMRTPSSLVAEHERADSLRDVIANLPELYRQALTSYKLEERSLTEVAASMGRTKNATCRIIARAMAQVRRLLSES